MTTPMAHTSAHTEENRRALLTYIENTLEATVQRYDHIPDLTVEENDEEMTGLTIWLTDTPVCEHDGLHRPDKDTYRVWAEYPTILDIPEGLSVENGVLEVDADSDELGSVYFERALDALVEDNGLREGEDVYLYKIKRRNPEGSHIKLFEEACPDGEGTLMYLNFSAFTSQTIAEGAIHVPPGHTLILREEFFD